MTAIRPKDLKLMPNRQLLEIAHQLQKRFDDWRDGDTPIMEIVVAYLQIQRELRKRNVPDLVVLDAVICGKFPP